MDSVQSRTFLPESFKDDLETLTYHRPHSYTTWTLLLKLLRHYRPPCCTIKSQHFVLRLGVWASKRKNHKQVTTSWNVNLPTWFVSSDYGVILFDKVSFTLIWAHMALLVQESCHYHKGVLVSLMFAITFFVFFVFSSCSPFWNQTSPTRVRRCVNIWC